MTLGLCMIVKNEEEVLARALGSAAAYADEIVVVDTGSVDGTKRVARQFTQKVYDFAWCDDFAAARNFAISKVTSDYFMWLDADDVVSAENALGINKLKKTLTDTDIVMLPYVLETDGNGNPTFSYYRERIIKNRAGHYFRGRVHEAIPLKGKIVRAPFSVRHLKPSGRSSGTRNLDIYEKMRAAGETFSPRETYYYARELYYNGKIERAAQQFESFIDDHSGFTVNRIDACVMLSRCYNRLGDKRRAVLPLYKSFEISAPTGEACCELGLIYFSEEDYRRAAFWFESATHCRPSIDSGAFVDTDSYGFLPFVWLTVCYDRLGDRSAAFKWHRRAKKLKPDHPSVLANSAYFESLNIRR